MLKNLKLLTSESLNDFFFIAVNTSTVQKFELKKWRDYTIRRFLQGVYFNIYLCTALSVCYFPIELAGIFFSF